MTIDSKLQVGDIVAYKNGNLQMVVTNKKGLPGYVICKDVRTGEEKMFYINNLVKVTSQPA